MLLPTSAQPSPLMDDAHSHIYYTHYEHYDSTCIFRDYSSVSFGDLRKKQSVVLSVLSSQDAPVAQVKQTK